MCVLVKRLVDSVFEKMKTFFFTILLYGLHNGHAQLNLKEIPEAPRLPDLDYNSLPEFIRKYLPTVKPVSNIVSSQDRSRNEAPRTYGMKLNNDQGIVWNDLLPSRMSYRVGDKNIARGPEKDIDDMIDDFINKIDNHTPVPEDNNKGNELTTPKYIPTTQLVNNLTTTPAPKPTSTLDDVSEKELLNVIGDKLDDIMKDVSKFIKIPHGNGTEDKIEEESSKITEGNNTSEDNKSNTGKDLVKNEITGKPAHDEQKPDLPYILELMIQNDELWQWLSDTTAKYLEILIARISTLVQEEVELLIQAYFETHECACGTNNNSKIPDLGSKGNIQKNATIKDKNLPVSKALDKTEETKKDNNKVNAGISDSGSQHYTEEDSLYKHNKDKRPESNKEDSKDKKDKKYERTTIYGNSVGNERVTNVFIFHMSSDIKPSVSSNNSSGSYIINFDKNTTSVDDKNKTNQDNAESEKVTTESTKIPDDSKEYDNVSTEIETDKDNDTNITETIPDKDKNNVTNATEETTENIPDKDKNDINFTEETTENIPDTDKDNDTNVSEETTEMIPATDEKPMKKTTVEKREMKELFMCPNY